MKQFRTVFIIEKDIRNIKKEIHLGRKYFQFYK